MPGIPDKIRSNIVRLEVGLTRYEAGLRARVDALVLQVGQDLLRGLLGSGLDTPRTDWQRARLRAMVAEAQAVINSAYADMGEMHADEMSGLVQVAGQGITTAVNDAFGTDLMLAPKWTREQLRAIAGDVLINGAPSSAWWSRQAEDLAQAFADSMRQGMMRGETITQLRDRILGQDITGVGAVGKVDLRTVPVTDRGVIRTARRNAEALVRSSVIATANSAHLEAFRANGDIMAGIQWLSTLDSRTTVVCRALDSLQWDMDLKPIGHERPFPGPTAHWGCRSTQMPKTKTWEELAREAHGNTRLARELDRISPGDRASIGGPVSGDFTYEQWFATQDRDTQLDILGPAKLKLWEAGRLGFTDMVDQRGNPLTLADLAIRYGK